MGKIKEALNLIQSSFAYILLLRQVDCSSWPNGFRPFYQENDPAGSSFLWNLLLKVWCWMDSWFEAKVV